MAAPVMDCGHQLAPEQKGSTSECEWKQGESAVANSGKKPGNLAPPVGRRSPVSVHDQKPLLRGRCLQVHCASRWSAIGLFGKPAKKYYLSADGFLMEAAYPYSLQFRRHVLRHCTFA